MKEKNLRQELLALVSSNGIQKNDFQLMLETGQISSQISDIFKQLIDSHYSVSIDYSMRLEDMIKNAQFQCGFKFQSEKFPIKGTGQVEVELELINLNRSASSQEVLDEMERRNLRAANIEELLAFAEKYWKFQLEFPIICLGSGWQNPWYEWEYPVLDSYESYTEIALRPDRGKWNERFRFLAVRKK